MRRSILKCEPTYPQHIFWSRWLANVPPCFHYNYFLQFVSCKFKLSKRVYIKKCLFPLRLSSTSLTQTSARTSSCWSTWSATRRDSSPSSSSPPSRGSSTSPRTGARSPLPLRGSLTNWNVMMSRPRSGDWNLCPNMMRQLHQELWWRLTCQLRSQQLNLLRKYSQSVETLYW